MEICKFEVGKTYHCTDRAIITVLSRTEKTVTVRWTNGYFGGTKRLRIDSGNTGGKKELVAFRNYNTRYVSFAGWLADEK